jgi:hypothetical protein
MAAGFNFPLELVDLATPSPSRGKESALPTQISIFTTVVLRGSRTWRPEGSLYERAGATQTVRTAQQNVRDLMNEIVAFLNEDPA